MATINAIRAGRWHDKATWDSAQIPGHGDTVQCGDFVVTIDKGVRQRDLILSANTGHFEIVGKCSIQVAEIHAPAGGQPALKITTGAKATVTGSIRWNEDDHVGISAR